MTELEEWLEQIGLGIYAEVLSENGVDLDVLQHLSDEDLKELGFLLGHRRKLLAALKEETEPRPSPTLQPPGAQEDVATKPEAERRQLTVMFCDLVGSTELSERLDQEELRDTLQRYHDAVAGAVITYQGHVAKLLGDGVLAYFGWPSAHEDDAERAIRSALAAITAVRGIQGLGTALAARAGIATGPVVIGDIRGDRTEEHGAVAGATPNLAARLQGLAQPGEIIIHAGTRQLVGATFELEEAGEQRLKGFTEPVAVWRVRGMAQVASRFEAMHGSGLTTFVGRTHEIGILLDRWRQAQDGEGQVVLLSGEAGIGKSRILREFSANLDDKDGKILRCQCSPHESNAAFHPIISEIEVTAGFLADDPPEVRIEKLMRHLTDLFSAPSKALPLFAALLTLPLDQYQPLDMAPQRRKQETIALLAARVARLSENSPLTMLVEDIHWADPSSLDALDTLVERVQGLPVLSVITHRPNFVPNRHSPSTGITSPS